MLLTYDKPHLSFNQQVARLENRGMLVEDKERAMRVLAATGYYHMSGYWYPYRKATDTPSVRLDTFKDGVSFNAIEKLMLFDSKLRGYLFGLIADIEIAMRCRIAYIVGKTDAFGHKNATLFEPEYLMPRGKYSEWITKLERQLDESRETFVAHYKQKYQLPFPIWISCELWDFGMISNFYTMLRREARDTIALSLSLDKSALLKNWLHALNVIRNICAHNARLWNRGLAVSLMLPSEAKVQGLGFLQKEHYSPTRIAAAIFVIIWLHRQINPQSKMRERLYLHLCELEGIHLPGLDYSVMGFKKDWENQCLWL